MSHLSARLAGKQIDQATEELVRSTLDRLVGLSIDLSPFAAMAAPDPLLGPLAARMRGLKPPRFPTVFEALVNGIPCQQLSLAVGIQLLNRLAADRGPRKTVPRARAHSPTLRSSHPSTQTTSSATASAPARLARSSGSPRRSPPTVSTWKPCTLEDGAAIERLTSLRGIGRWTAEYVLLRGLGRLHIFRETTSARTTS